MSRRITSIALVVVAAGSIGALLSALPSAQARVSATPASVSFDREIQPILEKRCLSCHGDTVQMGQLDLRTRDAALRGGAQGPALEHSRDGE